jgi:hypothetical protein
MSDEQPMTKAGRFLVEGGPVPRDQVRTIVLDIEAEAYQRGRTDAFRELQLELPEPEHEGPGGEGGRW